MFESPGFASEVPLLGLSPCEWPDFSRVYLFIMHTHTHKHLSAQNLFAFRLIADCCKGARVQVDFNIRHTIFAFALEPIQHHLREIQDNPSQAQQHMRCFSEWNSHLNRLSTTQMTRGNGTKLKKDARVFWHTCGCGCGRGRARSASNEPHSKTDVCVLYARVCSVENFTHAPVLSGPLASHDDGCVLTAVCVCVYV